MFQNDTLRTPLHWQCGVELLLTISPKLDRNDEQLESRLHFLRKS